MLAARSLLIYPGKLTDAPCFRIGTIGRLFEGDIREVLDGVRAALQELGVALPVRQVKA